MEGEAANTSMVLPARPVLPGRLVVSLVAVIVGSLVLRLAAQTMSQMLQFYFASIDRHEFETIHRNLSHTKTGLVTASFFITELLGSPILGALSDRFGRKKFMVMGPVLGAIAVQITSMTAAIWLLVFTRLLEGLSTASSIPATLGYISEATSGRPALRSRIVGLFETTFVGGVALGAVLGGYLWEHYSAPANIAGFHLLSPPFSINGLVYLASLLVFAWGVKEVKSLRTQPVEAVPVGLAAGTVEPDGLLSPPLTEGRGARYLAVLKSPKVLRFVPAWLGINSIVGMWTNHSVRLLTGKDHYYHQLLPGSASYAGFGKGYAAFAVVFAVGVLLWSLITGRYRRTSVMIFATSGLFLTMLAVFLQNHAAGPTSLAHPLTGVILVGLLIMSAFTPAALSYLADLTEEYTHDRGSIMGLYTVFLGIGQVIGTALGGVFATWDGIDGLILLSLIFGTITAITLWYLHGQEHPVRTVPGPPSDQAKVF